jgi:hypothetical protein
LGTVPDDRSLVVRCVPRNVNIYSRRVSDPSRGPLLLTIYTNVRQICRIGKSLFNTVSDDRSLVVRCVPRNVNIDSRRVSDPSRGPLLLTIYKKVRQFCTIGKLNINSRRVSDPSRGPLLLAIYKKVCQISTIN